MVRTNRLNPRSSCRNAAEAMCLAVMLAIGLAVAWGFLVVIGVETYESSRQRTGFSENLGILRDGTPLILHRTHAVHGRPTYRTLDGQDFVLGKDDAWLPAVKLPTIKTDVRPWGERSWFYRMLALHGQGTSASWYFMAYDSGERCGTGYFEIFDARELQHVGYLGVSGFMKEPPSVAESFSIGTDYSNLSQVVLGGNHPYGYLASSSAWTPVCVKHGGQVIVVDRRTRSTRVIFVHI
jgi:hypothetical protein